MSRFHADHFRHVRDAAGAIAEARHLHEQIDAPKRSAGGWRGRPCWRWPCPPSPPGGPDASRGLLAWTVVSEPSWPVFMACNMSSASSPRTSPTMMRSGRIRRALITRSRMLDGARAFHVRRARFHARHVRLLQAQFGRVFDGHDALVFRNVAESALSSVVLPAPVPPQIRMFSRALTQPSSSSSMPFGQRQLRAPGPRRAAACLPKRRMESSGPSTATGGMAAFTRDPSGRRASTSGEDSSTRRPTRDTTFSMMRSRCALSLNSTGVRYSLPPRST